MYTRDVQYPVADSEFDGKGGGGGKEPGVWGRLEAPRGSKAEPWWGQRWQSPWQLLCLGGG